MGSEMCIRDRSPVVDTVCTLIIAEHWSANKVVGFVGSNEARDKGSRKCTELTAVSYTHLTLPTNREV